MSTHQGNRIQTLVPVSAETFASGPFSTNMSLVLPPDVPRGEYLIYLSPHGFVGWTVGVTCSSPDANGQPIAIPPTVITVDGQMIGTPCVLAPGFDASLSLEVAPPAAGNWITLSVAYENTSFEKGTQMTTSKPNLATLIETSTTYPGFYFRNHLGGDGDVPNNGPYEVCPDIIASTTPITDPQKTLGSQQSWNQSYVTDPVYGATNYYYVRGIDGGADAVTDLPVSLFATPSQLILHPSTWQNGPLQTSQGSQTVNVSAKAGAIGVGGEAFVFSPERPVGQSDFYAFVAQATATIPEVGSWPDMASLLSDDLGLGFRNTLDVDPNATNWVHRIGLDVPADFDEATVLLTLSTEGMAGAIVALIADSYDSANQPILIMPQQVPQDSFTTGIQVTLNGGFSSTLSVVYSAGATLPAAGSTITLGANYVVPENNALALASRGRIDARRSRFLRETLTPGGITPTATMLVGCATFIVGS